MTTKKRVEDDDERKKKIAKDGERVTVPLTLMDAAAVADRAIREVSTPVMHKPGFVQLSDAERSSRERLYRNHDANVTERWKNPSQQVNPGDTIQSTGDARLNAYVHYEKRLTNAWRHR